MDMVGVGGFTFGTSCTDSAVDRYPWEESDPEWKTARRQWFYDHDRTSRYWEGKGLSPANTLMLSYREAMASGRHTGTLAASGVVN